MAQKSNSFYFIHALMNLNKFLDATRMNDNDFTLKDISILSKLLNISCNKIMYDIYIKKSFKLFKNNIKKISIWMKPINKLHKYFSSSLSTNKYLLSFSLIAQIFVNAEYIRCWQVRDINSSYILGLISEISEINKNKNTKLKYINIHSWYKIDSYLWSISFESLNWSIKKEGDKYLELINGNLN